MVRYEAGRACVYECERKCVFVPVCLYILFVRLHVDSVMSNDRFICFVRR